MTAIGDINKDSKVDGRTNRVGARVRAFAQIRELLALHRTEWEKDSLAAESTDEEKHDAEGIVNYIDHLSGQVDELENPPEVEKVQPGRPRNPAGPVSKRRYFVTTSADGSRVAHHVADPSVLFADGVRVFGPFSTEAGCNYRVVNGTDDATEVVRKAE